MSVTSYGRYDWELDAKGPGRCVDHQGHRARRRRNHLERFGVATHPSHAIPSHHRVQSGQAILKGPKCEGDAAAI